MEAIITAATVATMFFNISGSQSQSDYVYNAKFNDNKVEVMNVYNQTDCGLVNHYQYSYQYDEQNRLVSKTAQKWNETTDRWENAYELCYEYKDCGYEVSRSKWDQKANDFAQADQKMNYEMLGNEVMAVNTFRLDDNTKDYVLVDKILLMHPENEVLYAQTEKMEKSSSSAELSK